MQQTNPTKVAAARLALPAIITFSLATFPVSSLSVALFVYLPAYLAGHLGVALTAIGYAWATVRVVDIIIDPLIGQAMDRTTTRFGRYRVWLAGGAPILMLAAYMLFMAPKGVGGGYVLLWLFILYLGYSIVLLAQWSWGATLAREYHERSRVFGVLTTVGVVATVATLLIPALAPQAGLSNAEGVRAMGWFIITGTPIAIAISLWRTPERPNPTHNAHVSLRDYLDIARKPEVIRLFFAQMALALGPTWMSAMYLFYFRDLLGFDNQKATILLLGYILAGVVGAPLTSRLAIRIGKHQTLMVTSASFSVGLLGVLLIPYGSLLGAIPVLLWCGFMAAGFGLIINAMMADVGDEIRLHQGKERISLLYAVLNFAAKLAGAGAIAITYPLLASLGYDAQEGAHNTATALTGLQWAFLTGPIVCVGLGGACVIGWKLDAHRHAGVREQLDERDRIAETAAAALNEHAI